MVEERRDTRIASLADQVVRRIRRDMFTIAEEAVRRWVGSLIRGGRIDAGALSGQIPLSSLPPHQSTHQSGGSDALTGSVDANARLSIAKNGTVVGTRRQLNLIEGSNVTITATDNAANERIDVTIAATGGGGGGVLFGPYETRPAPGVPGRLYLATDSHYTYAVDTGTAWQEFLNGVAVAPPAPLSAWTAYNMSPYTAFEDRGAVGIAGWSPGGPAQIAVLARPFTVSPPCQIVMAFRSVGWGGTYEIGAGLMNSATTQIIYVGAASHWQSGSWDEQIGLFYYWNSPTSFNSGPGVGFPSVPTISGGVMWLRIDLNPATDTRAWFVSPDGVYWFNYLTQSYSTFMTPDSVCIVVRRDGSHYVNYILLHLSITPI